MDLNTRYALYLDEQRPIFLSGVDAYADPAETLYTRSITAPLAVLKLTGRQGRASIGALAALDTAPGASLVVERETPGFAEEDVEGRAASNAVLRWKRDLGGSFQAGALLTQKSLLETDGALHSSNTVLGADGYGTFGERYAVTGQVRGSLTGPAGTPLAPGVAVYGKLNRKASAGWGGFVQGAYRSPDFRAEMAFQNRVGIAKVDTYQRYRFERSGSLWFQPGAEDARAIAAARAAGIEVIADAPWATTPRRLPRPGWRSTTTCSSGRASTSTRAPAAAPRATRASTSRPGGAG